MDSTTVGGWVMADVDGVTVYERHAAGALAVASVVEDGEVWHAQVRAPGSLTWRECGRFRRLDDAQGNASADLVDLGWDA